MINHRLNEEGQSKYLDCSHCKNELTHEQRRRQACGWVPESDRSQVVNGETVPFLSYVPTGYVDERPEICAGYLCLMPRVLEAARAASWRREGALSLFYDNEPVTDLAKTAIDVMASSQREVENYNIRKAHEG